MMRATLPVDTLSTTSAALASAWRTLCAAGDEIAVLAGAVALVTGIAMLSIAAACISGGLMVAALGVGRIAFQTRGGSA